VANPLWDDLRRTADELEVQMHLAAMDARDRWRALKPRLEELEKTIAREGDRVGQAVSTQLSELGAALRRLRDDIAKNPKP
jgi:hypothetical protein